MITLYVNNVDLSLFGFTVIRVEGFGDAGPQRFPAAPVAGRSAQVLLSAHAQAQPRTVTATLLCRPGSLTALESAFHKLYALAGGGLVELRDGRDPDKVAYGFLEGAAESAYPPQYLAADPASQFTLRFTCYDPLRYARLASVIGFGALPGNIPTGTAPSAPLLRIYGQPTSPFTITARGMDGVARQVMGFTLALGANDFLEVDCDAGTITKSVAGTVTNAYDAWTTKSDGFILIDAHDGSWAYAVDHPDAGRAWPTLELSTGFGVAIYRKAYR